MPTRTRSDRGAVNNKRYAPAHSGYFWRGFFYSCLLFVACIVLGWTVYRLDPLTIIKDYTNKPIAHVTVEGDFKYVSRDFIEALVADKLTDTFLELDIVALKKHLEKTDWIDQVVVARQWPDTLLIRIIEQQPIARWNEQSFLNFRGEIVNLSHKTELNHLPLLRAEDRYSERVLQQYVLIAKLLGNYKFAPLVLELDNTLSRTLTISPDITIRLGREATLEKVQQLMQVIQLYFVDNLQKVSVIDMRYKQSFAVGWKISPQSE